MSKFWIIYRREYLQVVKKKSFIIAIFAIPLMMLVFTMLPVMLAKMKSSETEQISIIDRSGMKIGESFKEAISEYTLEDTGLPYYSVKEIYNIPIEDNNEYARIDSTLGIMIQNEDLKYYLVINPEPHLVDSNIYLVSNKQNFTTMRRFSDALTDILSKERLSLANVNLPVDSIISLTQRIILQIKDVKGVVITFENKYFPALAMIMIIYGMIIGFGQVAMRSVIEEKNSRIMEVLVSSVSPFELMMGKILGLCSATLTQVMVWIVVGLGINSFGAAFVMDEGLKMVLFNPLVITYFLLYLIVGFILYASIFTLLGSIVNSEKDMQPFIIPIAMVLMTPVIIGIYVIQNPSSVISTTLSFIPFMTPTMMQMRIIFLAPYMPEVSFFSGIGLEALLGFILVCLTTIFIVWLTSKVFRVGILMYGKRPTLPEIIKWVKYK